MSDCQYTKKVMKKIAYLLALLIFSASCSDDDSISTSLSVSNSELSFSADGGEQIVEIRFLLGNSRGEWLLLVDV